MALKTQGFALSAQPRSPAIPANVGAVDVKEIYDGVRQGLASFEQMRRAPSSMLLADAETQAKTEAAPLETAILAEQAKQAPLKTAILAADASPEMIAAKQKALLARTVKPLTGTPYLLRRMDELRAAQLATPDDPTLASAIIETQQLLNKASAVQPNDPNAALQTKENIAAAGNVTKEKIAAIPKSGLAAVIHTLIGEGYEVDDPVVQKLLLKQSAEMAANPDADRKAKIDVATAANQTKRELSEADIASREKIAGERNATTLAAAKAKRDADRVKNEPKVRSALEAATAQTSRIDNLIDTAIGKVGLLTTGFGAALANLPNTEARSLREDLGTIKANLGFNELNAMRQNSPTGGALGNVTERELDFLQKTIASLDQYLDGDDLINRLESVRREVKESWERIRRAYERDFGNQTAAPTAVKTADVVTVPTPDTSATPAPKFKIVEVK